MNKEKIFISFNYEYDRDYRYLMSAWSFNPRFEFIFYDRTPNESYYNYVQNSCNKSESYIRTFKNHSCDRPLFSFVIEDQLE